MKSNDNSSELRKLGHLGETKIINIIEEMVLSKTEKPLLKDDAFFYNLSDVINKKEIHQMIVSLNTDMLVSTSDVPRQMNPYQIGYKSVIMNLSDLIVKGVSPKAIMFSLGLPADLTIDNFRKLMNGIIQCSIENDIDYIGGDINQTKEIIINPTVFGIQEKNKIIYRKGMKEGDILTANGKFGLTGVGFDILLEKQEQLESFDRYHAAIESILNPKLGSEGLILSSHNLATASIDSSDGLARSLRELMRSNPGYGFAITMDHNLIADRAKDYSAEFNIPLERLVFEGGEEFIHLFTIEPKDYTKAEKIIRDNGGVLLKVGTVINDSEIHISYKGKKEKLERKGYEHFR
jgi:thiamine-monophosphate kinase